MNEDRFSNLFILGIERDTKIDLEQILPQFIAIIH